MGQFAARGGGTRAGQAAWPSGALCPACPPARQAVRLAAHTVDLDERRTLLAENLALNERIDHRWNVAWTKNHLGQLHLDAGNYQQAAAWLQASLEIHSQEVDCLGEGAALLRLGEVNRRQGRFARARDLFKDSLEKFRQTNSPYGACQAGFSSQACRRVKSLQTSSTFEGIVDMILSPPPSR